MSVSVSLNGSTFLIPSVRNETGWQTQLTTWIQSVSSNTLQKIGGTFTLTADINFGTSYGVTAKFFAASSHVNFTEGSGPSTPASGVVSAYAKTDKTLYYKDSTGAERQIATGSSSGINYASGTSSDFESGIGSWLTYADGAATPVDLTGGSPTATFTQSSSSPLRGSYSGLYTATGTIGQGVALAVTVPRADFASPIEISFNYEIGTSSSFTDGDIAIWVYDVTNSTLIQPVPYLLPKATGQEKFTCYFQTSATGTSYRVGIHQATANTGYTVKIDNVQIGPVQSNELGTIITDAQTYTPTLSTGAFGTNTNYFTWQRIGDSVRIIGRIAQTGAGTAGSGNYLLSLPTGLTIDTAKITPAVNFYNTSVGSAAIAGTTLTNSLGTVFAATSTSIGIAYVNATANATLWSSSVQSLGDANVSVAFDALIPIQGWSSSSVSSSADYTTRKINARYSVPTGTLAASYNVVKFTTKTYDQDSSYDTSTGLYTAKSAGEFKVSANVIVTGTSSVTTSLIALQVFKNSTAVSTVYNPGVTTGSQEVTSYISDTVSVVAGDTISIKCYTVMTGSPAYSSTSNGFISIEKSQGPSQVLPSESVNMQAAGTTTGGTGADSIIIFGTTVFDSHGSAYNTSTGRYTCPMAGKYRVSVAINGSNAVALKLFKDDSYTRWIGNTPSGVGGGSTIVSCLAGTILDVRSSANLGAYSSSDNSSLSIERIGS